MNFIKFPAVLVCGFVSRLILLSHAVTSLWISRLNMSNE
jgi:hypothetical protein